MILSKLVFLGPSHNSGTLDTLAPQTAQGERSQNRRPQVRIGEDPFKSFLAS